MTQSWHQWHNQNNIFNKINLVIKHQKDPRVGWAKAKDKGSSSSPKVQFPHLSKAMFTKKDIKSVLTHLLKKITHMIIAANYFVFCMPISIENESFSGGFYHSSKNIAQWKPPTMDDYHKAWFNYLIMAKW